MKKMFLVLAIILMLPALAWSAHIACDPLAVGVTSVKIDGLPGGVVSVPLMPDRTIYYDIAGLAPGSYTIKAAACAGEGIWEACTDYSDPLDFTKPTISLPETAVVLKLTK